MAKVLQLAAKKDSRVVEKPIPYVPAVPRVTHAIEQGEAYVFLVYGGQSVGVPSAMARLIARDIIASAAEAEAELRRVRHGKQPL